jgi:hypothetical protein
MITPPDYFVMGGDGQEYGPVSAEKIRAWIAEQRLECKTPVKSPHSKDWVFLESLPEFADMFRPSVSPPKPNRRIWPLVTLFVLSAVIIIVALVKFINFHR